VHWTITREHRKGSRLASRMRFPEYAAGRWFELLDARHARIAAGLWSARTASRGLWLSGGPFTDAVSRRHRHADTNACGPVADARFGAVRPSPGRIVVSNLKYLALYFNFQIDRHEPVRLRHLAFYFEPRSFVQAFRHFSHMGPSDTATSWIIFGANSWNRSSFSMFGND
jgi:hypothetical protein